MLKDFLRNKSGIEKKRLFCIALKMLPEKNILKPRTFQLKIF